MEITTMITIANAGFVILLIALMIAGYKNGLILSLLNCVGWIIALVAAYLFSPTCAQILTLYPLKLTPMADTPFGPVFQSMLNQLVWFVLIAAAIKLVCLLLKPLAKGFRKIPVLGFFNNVLGALFGLVNMWIWTSIICMVLSLPAISWGSEVVDGSLLKSASLVSDIIMEKIDVNTEEIEDVLSTLGNLQNLDETKIAEIRDQLSQIGITQEQIDALFENLE